MPYLHFNPLTILYYNTKSNPNKASILPYSIVLQGYTRVRREAFSLYKYRCKPPADLYHLGRARVQRKIDFPHSLLEFCTTPPEYGRLQFERDQANMR
jgi:hypothetical protein